MIRYFADIPWVLIALFSFCSICSGAPSPVEGLWISASEIADLPTTGMAWNNVKGPANNGADSANCTPDLSNQDEVCNTTTLARALVFVRLQQESYRIEVENALQAIINSGAYNGRALALGRKLAAYVIAADLIDLKNHNSAMNTAWRAKILELRNAASTEAGSLVECHENRPNNWGGHCGCSRIAVDRYIGDSVDLDRAAIVFKGWLGDRTSYAGFNYGTDDSWQCDATRPVGLNPLGCTKQGHDIDGVVPDDQRRAGSFMWPPVKTDYTWGMLGGAICQAELLHRAGYDAFNWESRALSRGYAWLHRTIFSDGQNYKMQPGDSANWQPWIVNYRYGTNYPAPSPTDGVKNLNWTDWTHGPGRRLPNATIPKAPTGLRAN